MPDRSPHGTILVVDDHPAVRAVLRRQLTAQGHTVLEAVDGAEALHLVRRRNGAVDLVLSDVVMPQVSGTELAGRICVEFPGVAVILMSAFSPPGTLRIGTSDTIVPVLQKPVDPRQLEELLTLALRHPVPGV